MRFLLLLSLALPTLTQEQEVQHALIERDQRTEEFAARLLRDVKPELPVEPLRRP